MKKIFFIFASLFLCTTFVFAQTNPADEYQLLSGVPGLSAIDTSSGNFSDFINTIYRMSIGLGAALAVVIILFEGIRYSLSDSFGVKAQLKEKIMMSLGGLALLMGAFIFLQFINPDLTDLDNKGVAFSNIDSSGLDFEPFNVVSIESLPPTYTSLETNVWIAQDGTGGTFDTEQECLANGVSLDPRSPTRCQYIPNPDVGSTSVPPDPNQNGVLTLAARSPYMNLTLNSATIAQTPALDGWPVNPYRSPVDFIDCKGKSSGTQSVLVTQRAVAADAYINYNLERLGLPYPIPINSAYRHNPDCDTTGTRANHPYGASFDYSIRPYNSDQKRMLQQIVLDSGAMRMGFGANFYHVQWDGRGSGPNVYWCYSSNPNGSYAPMPSGWRTGSC